MAKEQLKYYRRTDSLKKYTGNQEGFIYVSYKTSIQKEVLDKYLEPLAHDGIKFYWSNAFDGRAENNLRKSNALLLFLTKDFAGESKLHKTVAAATRYDKPILTVYLENVELDDVLSMQIESQQAIFKDRYEADAEFIEALSKAEIFDDIQITEEQKRKQKGRVLLIAMAALVITLAVAGAAMKVQKNEEVDPTNLTNKDLRSIEELCIIGTEIVSADERETDEGDGGFLDELKENYPKDIYEFNDDEDEKGFPGKMSYKALYLSWDENGELNEERITIMKKSNWRYYRATGHGDISDLTSIAKMKNLKILQLDGQQIKDTTPLTKLRKLEKLSLACNPVSSLDGLENLKKLEYLDISYTDVGKVPDGLHVKYLIADNSELTRIPDFGGLSKVRFQAGGAPISDVSNAGTAESYVDFSMDCGNVPTDQLMEGLKEIPVKYLYLHGVQADSMYELESINAEKLKELCIDDSNLTSLDGIEHFEGIEFLDLAYCGQLTDLSAVNNLKSLKKLHISSDMEWMKDAVDDRIQIEIYD